MPATLAAPPVVWPTRPDGRMRTGLITGPAAERIRTLNLIAATAAAEPAPTRIWGVSPHQNLHTAHLVWVEDGGTDIHHHLMAVIDYRHRQLAAGVRWTGEPCALYPQLLVLVDDLAETGPSVQDWSQVATRGPRAGVVLIAANPTPLPSLAQKVAHQQEQGAIR